MDLEDSVLATISIRRPGIQVYKKLTAMRPEKAPAIEYMPLLHVSKSLSLEQEKGLTRTVRAGIPNDT